MIHKVRWTGQLVSQKNSYRFIPENACNCRGVCYTNECNTNQSFREVVECGSSAESQLCEVTLTVMMRVTLMARPGSQPDRVELLNKDYILRSSKPERTAIS